MHCASEHDAAQDAFVSLKSNIADMVDIWNDVAPSSHRDWLKSAYDQVAANPYHGFSIKKDRRSSVVVGATSTTSYSATPFWQNGSFCNIPYS
jgi:hypothetical protein